MSKKSLEKITELEDFESTHPELPEHKLLRKFLTQADLEQKHLLMMQILSFADQNLNPRWEKPLEAIISPSSLEDFLIQDSRNYHLINLDYVFAKIVLSQIKKQDDYASRLTGDNLWFFFNYILELGLALEDKSFSEDFIARKCAFLALFSPKGAWQDFTKMNRIFEETSSLKEKISEEILSVAKSFRQDLLDAIKNFEEAHISDKITSPNINITAPSKKEKPASAYHR